jgi:phosphoglycolate phosphatase-like HAD superfamily hydrolase
MGLFRRTTDEAIETISATYAIDPGALNERFRVAYDRADPVLQPPFPFAREVCAYLVAQGGSNFIVTHRTSVSLERLLIAHGLSHLFSDLVTADDPYPRKPDPASILALLLRYRLDSRRCMLVGDRDLDLEAGIRAGTKTCFFGGDNHVTRADLEVTGLDQLLHWLERSRPPVN